MEDLFDELTIRMRRYSESIQSRRVSPSAEAVEGLQALDVPLQDDPCSPTEVISLLDEIGSPATVASSGGRYYGFVIGGALPAALAANLLAGVWDQNAGLEVASPVAAALEDISSRWLLSLLGLPGEAGVGFVTGATMANFTALAAARHVVLERVGWDVEANGLIEAPPITVVVGQEVHVTVLKALSMLGLGRDRVVRVDVDGQGRMRADRIPKLNGPTMVCTQAGNVNTGAFDPIADVLQEVRGAENAWLHVDGAFGLWAAASPDLAHLTRGMSEADSLATDAHKWLNVPYDSGLVFVRDARALMAAMSTSAAYLLDSGKRQPFHYVPELSRRARGVEVWAALRSLGKKGLAELIERNCRQAAHFAEGLKAAGHSVLNEVVLNQVLVSFGEPDVTDRIIRRVQEEGTCWCGGTQWQGEHAMRISVSSWRTTDEDVRLSLEAILQIAAEEVQKE